MIGLTQWRDDKISKLEETLESYRLRNKQLEDELIELNELKLKCKIQQMLIDDDPAIDELLECSKKNKTVQVRHDYGNAMAQQTRMALFNQGSGGGLQQLCALGFANQSNSQISREQYLNQLSSAAMW